jgi:PPOX class probable F420-dependent enzyme
VEDAELRLAREEIGWLTTVDDDGRPQSSPLWFLWQDGVIHVATEPSATKVRNVLARPDVAFHLEGAGPGEVVVTLEGTAELAATMPDAYTAKYAAAFVRIGTTPERYLAEFSTVLRVTPARRRVFVSR